MDIRAQGIRFIDLRTFSPDKNEQDRLLEIVINVINLPCMAQDADILLSLDRRSANLATKCMWPCAQAMLKHLDQTIFSDGLLSAQARIEALQQCIALDYLGSSKLIARVYRGVFSTDDQALDTWVDWGSARHAPSMAMESPLAESRCMQVILSHTGCCVELKRLLVCALQPHKGILLGQTFRIDTLTDVYSIVEACKQVNERYALDQTQEVLRLLRTRCCVSALSNCDDWLRLVAMLMRLGLSGQHDAQSVELETEVALTVLSLLLCTEVATVRSVTQSLLDSFQELLSFRVTHPACCLLPWVRHLAADAALVADPVTRVMGFIDYCSTHFDEDHQVICSDWLARLVVEEPLLLDAILEDGSRLLILCQFCDGTLERQLAEACLPLRRVTFCALLDDLGHNAKADRYWSRFLMQLKAFAEGYPSYISSPQALGQHADNLRCYFGDSGLKVLLGLLRCDEANQVSICYDLHMPVPNRSLVAKLLELLVAWFAPEEQVSVWCALACKAIRNTQSMLLDTYLNKIVTLRPQVSRNALQNVQEQLQQATLGLSNPGIRGPISQMLSRFAARQFNP